ncbi:Putative hydrolase MhqD [Lacunisphaera limnophila]|uniref:Hydrolase MhqD n=1 Tax=Lacunisphaera limnophila TaxID=1838286 RepID=A0A1D8AWK3_9BACT|nr:alpha/beta hydrolase [Lacunisphaera limnophila]AOS45269.1 Putative hydrolase MhqD [Lacunisphaera limnophila]
MSSLSYLHRFEPGDGAKAPPLLLLHGTGGNENDLLPLGRQLAPGSPLLSPRGDVSEHGMPRFFRRFAEGVFDLKDVAQRTQALADFVAAAAREYGFDPNRLAALGYSNGANIAASLLLLRPESLTAAVLLRPMVVLEPKQLPDLTGKRISLLSGRHDPIVPVDHPPRLAEMFRRAGASVDLHWLDTGHQLTEGDLQLAAGFLAAES